ncbi:hypothetical protein C8R44DRAFT_851557 [Mycena epipterygia]|nr:hypothetical protein C8R44DRAFT_851557 [Mycena epipterygia]
MLWTLTGSRWLAALYFTPRVLILPRIVDQLKAIKVFAPRSDILSTTSAPFLSVSPTGCVWFPSKHRFTDQGPKTPTLNPSASPHRLTVTVNSKWALYVGTAALPDTILKIDGVLRRPPSTSKAAAFDINSPKTKMGISILQSKSLTIDYPDAFEERASLAPRRPRWDSADRSSCERSRPGFTGLGFHAPIPTKDFHEGRNGAAINFVQHLPLLGS